jgi:asparagine synthase (glutamine-hydrolysing)
MCGINGFWREDWAEAYPARLQAMTDALAHRGPDGQGQWTDPEQGLALGHRRLAIIDLSPDGAQPMQSRCGRYVVVFNGEIYNYRALRAELAEDWRGHSDTEVLLAAVVRWGLEASLRRFNGMFAFALWDRQTASLTLARDRFGEKPLYYRASARGLAFASELKALRQAPGWQGEIDRDALACLLARDYIAQPHSIYRDVRKLPPASYLVLRAPGAVPEIHSYWDARAEAHAARADLLPDNEATLDGLEGSLTRAVGLRMHADVPLGAFLSGGIDSSLIVALMQAQASQPVRSFSIGFSEAAYNEAPYAAAVARHLGTTHTELIVTPEDALAVIPRLPQLYDEPFADSSQIPTFLVSQMAREHVTVALSGDAGDELFGGYNRYRWLPALWRRMAWLPQPARRLAASGVTAVSPAAWDGLVGLAARLTGRQELLRNPGDKLHKLARVLDAPSPADLYARLISFWPQPEQVVLGASCAAIPPPLWEAALGLRGACMLADSVGYLPDDILVKVDRASMAASLEGRMPFLDPEVYAQAWRLPEMMKIRDGVSKWALRQILYRHVPPALIDRPKAGFSIPIDRWLRGPLRDWAEALLAEDRLRREGFFAPAPIRLAWAEHLSGRRNWQYHLWSVLMFQLWHEAWHGR